MTSPRDKGGIHARRGFLFQDYSLLYYLLIRRLEFPDLEAIIESKEDASFVYPINENGETQKVTELIQCKKRESQDSMDVHAGVMRGDEWPSGKVTLVDLKNWVEAPEQQSACDILKNNEHTYFTLLLCGKPSTSVKEFIPKGFHLNSVSSWYLSWFEEVFPLSYKHQQDPNTSKHSFGTFDIRCRIRILPIDSPKELKFQCRLLLEGYYQVSERKSAEVLRRLHVEIESRSTATNEENRSLLLRDIETIIAEGRVGKGRWQTVQKFLEQNNLTPADPNQGEPPRWIDFETGRYAHRDEFDRALEALEHDGFIVVSGAAGTGKTTLCRFLGFRFLNEHPKLMAYYLSVSPSESINDEIEFLKGQMYSDTLFIVDDQHFALDEVENLVRTFADFRLEGKTRARLVVTSTITYSRTQASRGSILNQVSSIAFLSNDKEEVKAILHDLRTQAELHTSLSDEELASLSDGNVELALILARCSREFKHHLSFERLFSSKILGQTLTNWVLERVGRRGESKFFKSEIIPVFVIGGYGLPIPQDFTTAIDVLHDAGFLENYEIELESNASFRPISIYLAFIFRKQHNEQQVDILSNYLARYPRQLPAICEQLKSSDYGCSVLKKLMSVCFEDIVEVLNDRFEPIELDGISKVLRGLYFVDRTKSKILFRRIATNRFFSNFLSPDRTRRVTSLKSFFEIIYGIDRDSIRQLAEKQLEGLHAKFILSLFKLDSNRLDEIGACLHAMRKLSSKFANKLYEDLKRSPAFITKITHTDNAPGNLSIWLRFCKELRSINRGDCYNYLDAHLTSSKVMNAFLMNPEFNFLSQLLLRLRRLHPKLAANICSEIWQEHRDLLENLLTYEPDLDAISNNLYAMSQLNRRIAIKTGFSVKNHICTIVGHEDHYNKISSALEVFRKNVGLTFAHEVSLSIDRDHLLPLIQQENQKFALVGKFLCSLAFVSIDLANWFEEHLDYRIYLQQICISHFHVSRLHNMVHLIRGFITAAHPKRKLQLLAQLLDDPLLADEFQRGYREATNLTQIGFCLALLLDCSIEKLRVLSLLNMSPLDFQNDILERFANENTILHIANGLYAVAKLDLEIATVALEEYVKRVESDTQKEVSKGGVQARRRQQRRRRFPRGNEPNDLVEVGCLFQVAASIEPTQARQLAVLLDYQEFAEYAKRETNLGRLTIFLHGLKETSHKLASEFIEHICFEKIWQRQYEENESLENIVHYTRMLGSISRTKGREYVLFLIENHLNDIQNFLEIEVNMMQISNWLKVLSIAGQDFADQHVNHMSKILITTFEYDTQLRHFLEATEALIECGQTDLAGQFANRALKETSQMRSVHNLRDWIVLFHKAMRIGRELQIPDFPSRLYAEIDEWYFTAMFILESQPLLSAYTYHMLKSADVYGLNKLKHTVFEQQVRILDAVRDEHRIVFKALVFILAESTYGEIRIIAESDGWNYPWGRGLAALLFANIFPDEDNPFAIPPKMPPGNKWQDLLCEELNEHTGNLEYGLTLHIAAITGLSRTVLDQFQKALSKRVDDELINSTRWLLQQTPGMVDFNGLPYYVWTYIRNTVLRSTYLTWEDDLEKTMDSMVFNKPYRRDLTTILS